MRSAVLMCHAPIVIPDIAGPRAVDCATTTAAMQRTARAVVATRPSVLVVLSPHTPRDRTRWGLVTGDRLAGSFARFGHPGVALSLPNAHEAVREALGDVPLADLSPYPLDHGALVPLWFLVQAGWHGPTAVLGVPWSNTHGLDLGRALSARADWAVVASGDMSHRLLPGAPAGFDPEASRFDEGFVQSLRAGRLEDAVRPDADLRERAAEDVVDTTEVLLGALGPVLDFDPVLAYEGPFGVGYCEAVLHPRPEPR
ncbi:MAG: class III extradiol dioxygenase subunit B-like domain-containing protein [Myxococcota bacterium]